MRDITINEYCQISEINKELKNFSSIFDDDDPTEAFKSLKKITRLFKNFHPQLKYKPKKNIQPPRACEAQNEQI